MNGQILDGKLLTLGNYMEVIFFNIQIFKTNLSEKDYLVMNVPYIGKNTTFN